MKTLSYLALTGFALVEQASAAGLATAENVLKYDGPTEINTSMKTNLVAWEIQPLQNDVDWATVKACKEGVDWVNAFDPLNSDTYKQEGTKPFITIWSGSCKTVDECAMYTEQAFNWWAGESGYACVSMFYDVTTNSASATAYATGEVVEGGAVFKAYYDKECGLTGTGTFAV